MAEDEISRIRKFYQENSIIIEKLQKMNASKIDKAILFLMEIILEELVDNSEIIAEHYEKIKDHELRLNKLDGNKDT